MANVIKRVTTYPHEQVIQVVEGAKCYRGHATSLMLASGEEVIIIGLSDKALRAVFKGLAIRGQFSSAAVSKVVVLSADSVELDDEL